MYATVDAGTVETRNQGYATVDAGTVETRNQGVCNCRYINVVARN